ncbi:rRNA pseudouridine synthase [Candidatus Woesearchaeota archaeon]|jgi:23S rRNA pseudouridine2605 synthase|nr:rRNA pseudouridine synthase [Candidatus Woesearchaeota archaeon]MBT7062841.1 rRNA pseudouridine synthase [Candidatus Woesearchaeota archaeon]MBT7403006.1 rRNA pseudouridine synthase [Candidatus Woesearchaeota archaeon]
MHRVQKLISNYGYCSRRKAEELIDEGRVEVNGKVISLGNKATDSDKITVDGKLISKQERVYLMFNKPLGCVTALKDPKYKTIMHYIKIKSRVFPIGRLDYNTSGLILLTNDGDFANKIMHPRYEIKKTYRVELNKPLSEQHILQISKGVTLEDGKTAPAKVRQVDKTTAEIILHEGKNRIVRRIFNSLGYKIRKLERIQVGSIKLGKLESGKYTELTPKQIASF